ncbi:methionine ABC transporter ATP-binding protein [Oceanobacillus chungangensis]|uniref:Phosphate ABC transporter ATP-binding protein n=1 Tax=Oceanobacillus chungangensis TaxID=1229152 RepID=A0A3D8PLU7_9BACI|nr:methionine ABC transporter ATP-binding protein [Oceanobacillus chungangensis]RDW16642.1 phosphate ABC transporter ATP-binding protein [Oceanobacillus chungangensis]
MIEFKDVSKTFTLGKREVHAVKNVSLTINKGEIFGIIGFSGAGKSTLLRLVNMLERPSSGSVLIQDIDVSKLSAKDLRTRRRNIGMIFQNFNLFNSRTVAGNIAYPLKLAGASKKEINARVTELLNFVGLAEKAKDYPDQLSGGQKQRVGIARALATSPDILICDEATSALDPETTADILKLLKKVNKDLGITILLITHEMHVIQSICDKVAVMEDGEVIESGNVFETFTDPQHTTTQRFIRSVQQDLPSETILKEWHASGGGTLYRVIFKGEITNNPVLSTVTRKHDVDFNIVYGSVRELQERLFGNLIVSFIGEQKQIDIVRNELKTLVDIEEVIVNER